MRFRFGVTMHQTTSRQGWTEKCRKAESLGFDVVSVADHLGMPAPFPALMLAAEATERVRVVTHMLNANFYRPVLAARELATVDLLTDGRLEIGLGAGHARPEFAAVGVPYGSGGDRVDGLVRLVAELRRQFADPEANPRPVQRPGPPLMIAGRGDRMLRFAAREADIVAFNGADTARHERGGLPTFASAAAMAERVEFARAALGDRVGEVEFNCTVPSVVVTTDTRAALGRLDRLAPDLTIEERADVPSLLVGTPDQLADKLRRNHDRFGFGYITVMEGSMDAMGQVIELLR